MRIKTKYLYLLTLIMLIVMTSLGVQNSLDARIYYDYHAGLSYLQSLSSDLSYKYLIKEILDLGLICLYTGLFKRGVRQFLFPSPPLLFIFLVPGFFDFVETLSILLMLKKMITYSVLGILGVITFLKWASGTILFFAIIYKWKKQL